MRPHLAAFILVLALPSAGRAQVASPLTPATLTDAVYTQNFNTLISQGKSNVMPAGWQIVEAGEGSLVDGYYQVGTGSSNSGNAYNFGANGTTDRALGALTSGSVAAVTLGAVFTNRLGGTIGSVALSFTGEQWRFADAANTLFFEYSTDATSLLDGTWTALGALDFASLITGAAAGGALDGNAAANRRLIAGTIGGLAIADGGRFGLRWTMRDVPGGDPGLAVDDLRLAASAVPEPASWTMMLAGFGATGGWMRRRRIFRAGRRYALQRR